MQQQLSRLSNSHLAILGLYQMGRSAVSELARASGRPEPEVRKLLASKSGQIRDSLSFGLPAGLYADLAEPVACRLCDGRVTVVPCVLCYKPSWSLRDHYNLEAGAGSSRPIRRRCGRNPGSGLKLAILAKRAARGADLFSPLDPKISHDPTGVVQLRYSSWRRLGGTMSPHCRLTHV